jgi:uncharacterized protein (DUF433 family)
MGFVMATALATTSYPHIVKTPEVCSGKARIDGTRIAVVDVVIAYRQGHSPEAIRTLFSSRPLTLAEVASALAYADDNRAEIEEYLQRDAEAEAEAVQAEVLRRKAARR